MTGKCIECEKEIELGRDGACTKCAVEVCWDCWVKAGHECPKCGGVVEAAKEEKP